MFLPSCYLLRLKTRRRERRGDGKMILWLLVCGRREMLMIPATSGKDDAFALSPVSLSLSSKPHRPFPLQQTEGSRRTASHRIQGSERKEKGGGTVHTTYSTDTHTHSHSYPPFLRPSPPCEKPPEGSRELKKMVPAAAIGFFHFHPVF